jgi:hypothetical protein
MSKDECHMDRSEWIDKRAENIPITLDERLILKILRYCKAHYEFFIGLIAGIVVSVVVII